MRCFLNRSVDRSILLLQLQRLVTYVLVVTDVTCPPTPLLPLQIPYTMGKQVSFDIITKLFYAAALLLTLDKGDSSVKWCISVLSAFFAAVIACVTSQPGDVILTNTYGGSSHGGASDAAAAVATSSTDFTSVVAAIYRKHGFAGFYLGLQARLAHVASIITSQLVVYDVVKMALGLPVTGSH